ncbi:MAG TPA: hypothetical protein V6C72_02565, partial [Chroococcales cyanobacterium]
MESLGLILRFLGCVIVACVLWLRFVYLKKAIWPRWIFIAYLILAALLGIVCGAGSFVGIDNLLHASVLVAFVISLLFWDILSAVATLSADGGWVSVPIALIGLGAIRFLVYGLFDVLQLSSGGESLFVWFGRATAVI